MLEPSEDEALEILKGLRGHYESHHGVNYTDEALEAAVALSAKHLKDLHLPDKAIDVIDEAGAAQKLRPRPAVGRTPTAVGGPLGRPAEIGPAEIEQIVAKMARVPVQAVSSDDKRALADLDGELRRVIFGQDAAIDEVVVCDQAVAVGPALARQADRQLPVRRTDRRRQDRAGAAAGRILGVEFIRFDMSEYMEKHAVSRLIGAPPGYVGYEEGGLLIDAVRKSPHAVLLLDEIEKAHPDMFAILLQVMDHATLTDSHGRKADFRHVILIMTTNAGSARSVRSPHRVLPRRRRRRLVARRARADVHAGVPQPARRYRHLRRARRRRDREGRRQADRRAARRWSRPRACTIELDPAARAWLAVKGFDRAFGARPMARLIEQKVKKPLSELLLFGALASGGAVRVELQDEDVRLVVGG